MKHITKKMISMGAAAAIALSAVPQMALAADGNLAEGKTATSEHTAYSRGPEHVVDGSSTFDNTKRFATLDNVSDAGKDIIIDLGEPMDFNRVVFYELHHRIGAWKIQYSDNGTEWQDTSAGEVTCPDAPKEVSNSSLPHTVSFDTVTARYMRLYVTKDAEGEVDTYSKGMSLNEIEIYNDYVPTDEENVAADTEALTAESVTGHINGWVKDTLELPVAGENGSSIAWKASDEDIITIDPQTGKAVITRPAADTEVTLTATVSKGEAQQEKDITITVLAAESTEDMEWTLVKEYSFDQTETNEDYEVRYNNTAVAELTADENGLLMKQTDNAKFADGDRPEITVFFNDLIDDRSQYYIEVEYNSNMLAGETRVQMNNKGNTEAALFSMKPASNQYLTAAAKPIGGNRTWLDNVLKMPNNLGVDQTVGIVYDTFSGQYQFVQNGAIVTDTKYINSYGQGLGGLWVSFQGGDNGLGSTFLLKGAKVYKYMVPEPETDEDFVELDMKAVTLESIGASENGEVRDNLTLPSEGDNGSAITWASDNEGVINPQTGAVTKGDTDVDVTLTATFTKGSVTKTKEFKLKVIKKNPTVEKWTLVQEIPFNSLTSDFYTLSLCDDPSVATVTADENGIVITQVKNDANMDDSNKPDIKLNLSSILTDENGIYYVETAFNSSMTANGSVRMQYSYDNGPGNYGEVGLFEVGQDKLTGRGSEASVNLSYTNGQDTTVGQVYNMATKTFQIVKDGEIADSRTFTNKYGKDKPLFGIWFRFQGNKGGAGSTYCLQGVKIYKLEKVELSDQDLVDAAAEALTADSIVPGGVITKAMDIPITLPTTGENGVSIAWSSDKPDVLDGQGNVTRPKADNETVTLTATLTYGTGSAEKKIEIIVEAMNPDMTADEKIQEDMNALTNEALGAAADGSVSGNLTLPAKGAEFGSDITYTAQPEGVINTQTGEVTHSMEGDVQVTLTASFALDGAQNTKSFTLNVKQKTYDPETLDGLNLALNKTASASDAYSESFTADKAVDGDDTTTRYASLDTVDNAGKFFMVDFGGPKSFNYVKFKEWQSRIRSYKIQYSNDGETWYDTSIGEQTKTNISETAGHTWTTTPTFDTVTARYVRMLITNSNSGDKGLSLWEFQVYYNGQYTNDMFTSDVDSLTIESILGNNPSADAVTENLAELPKGLANGANVVWSSTDETAIATDGTVTKDDAEDKAVTLTAVITSPRGTMTETKTFSFTVLKKTDDELAVERDTAAVIAKALELGLNQTGTANLKENIALSDITAAAVNGANVTWQSSDETVIKNDGTILADPENDKEATLTCTIEKGAFKEVLTYAVKVPAAGDTVDGDLAKGAKVTSSGKVAAGCSADKATDRRYLTKWFTSGQPNTASIIVDLGSEMNVANVTLMEAPDGDVYTVRAAEISVSTDNKTFTKVADVNGVGESKDVTFVPQKARYIKYEVTSKEAGDTGLFELIVKYEPNSEDVVKADKEAFEWPYGYLISDDIELPDKGEFGSDITWSSSNTKLITNDGQVTINQYEDSNGNAVTMTATFEKDGATQTLKVNIKIDTEDGKRPSGGGGGSSAGGGSHSGGTTGLPTGTGNATHGVDNGSPNQQPEVSVFGDVSIDRWSYPYIKTLYEKSIVNGDADRNFNPDQNVTREQLVKMIVEALAIPQIAGDTGFTDVDASQWYADYLYTAQQAGIVNGISETEFGVGRSVTRQDMATMIYRAVEATGHKVVTGATAASFTDGENIDDYAKASVEALVGAGIINGVDGAFMPNDFATREQCAKVICMVMEKLQ